MLISDLLIKSILQRVNEFYHSANSKDVDIATQNINILFLITGSNHNNAILRTLLSRTNWTIYGFFLSRSDKEEDDRIEGYINYLTKYYDQNRFIFEKITTSVQNKKRITGFASNQQLEIQKVLEITKKTSVDFIIFDYLSNWINGSSIFSLEYVFKTKLKKQNHIPNLIFPYLDIKGSEISSVIFSILPYDLTNFNEIYQDNQKIIKEIQGTQRSKYEIDIQLETGLKYQHPLRNNIVSVYRYLLSQGILEECEFLMENYGHLIDRRFIVYSLTYLLSLKPACEKLLNLSVEKGKITDYEINNILIDYLYTFSSEEYITEDSLQPIRFFYQKYKEKITNMTRSFLIYYTQRTQMNHKLFDFLVKEFDCDPGEAMITLLNSLKVNEKDEDLISRLSYIFANYKDKISPAQLNKSLLTAEEKKYQDVIEFLGHHGANLRLLEKKNKNYGWSKFLIDHNLLNLVNDNHLKWFKSNFDSFVDVMNDFLFNEDYGFYGSGIVKIGGEVCDFTTNVTRDKGIAFLLVLTAINQWKKFNTPSKFVILELCGGNGKLANDILTMSEIISKNIEELRDFYPSIIYRTVDISHSLSKLEMKRNQKFVKEGKFEVINSDVADNKWLKKFPFKKEKGFIFSNEIIDVFIPPSFIVKESAEQQKHIFNQFLINYLLVDNFDHFYNLCKLAGKFTLAKDEAKTIYDDLLVKSSQFKKNFKAYFAIECHDSDLIINSKDFREKIIPVILNPALNLLKSLRNDIFNLEEIIEEKIRTNKNLAEINISKVKIDSLIYQLETNKVDLQNIWNHFCSLYLPLPEKLTIRPEDTKFLARCELYPENCKIFYQEEQLAKMLEITAELTNYELFCFDYGSLDTEKQPFRSYYGFSYVLDYRGKGPFSIQNRFENDKENFVSDLFSELFLGKDITLPLNFEKVKAMAFEKGWKAVGLYHHQSEFDNFIKNQDIHIYKAALDVVKNSPGFLNMEKDIKRFRMAGQKTFRVISLNHSLYKGPAL